MADQTPLGAGPDPRHQTDTTMTRSMADLLHDITQLAELQAKLLAVDLRESAGRMGWAAAVAGVGAVLLLGCIPVLLLGIAYALVEGTGLGLVAAVLWTAIVALVIALLLMGIGYLLMRRNVTLVERSREELRRNLTWIRTVLKQRGQTTHAAGAP